MDLSNIKINEHMTQNGTDPSNSSLNIPNGSLTTGSCDNERMNEDTPDRNSTAFVDIKSSPKKSPFAEKRQPSTLRSFSTNDAPSFYTLKNWETGVQIKDALFFKAQAKTECTRHRCTGSVMSPDFMNADPRKNAKTNGQKLELAVDFIKQYYGSMKRKNPGSERKRLEEVRESIEKTGAYQLTQLELIFGVKTAWRNAPRCIGRIQWNNLQVFDQRHVESTAEMFKAICNHLKYATNSGNIRSCITIFPPRSDDFRKDFRVWNSQYILYAGYKQPDGRIIGDPKNADFTELCIKLGWAPKGGRFDVLPLVLQAHGEDPDWYNIPTEIVLEVQLHHPRFDWFKNLGLKWCAVPAVSDMLLDIGGIEFPAAPFNGWFMGTEIARDLCDSARYNVLEEVAQTMKLDTRNTSSLWKDVAFVEFNIAVLHSFQANCITIMDHHAASESFMKHFSNEMKSRGGCPGDWVWLTPPVSGNLTPIFHQEILNYGLNPSYMYQPPPWKYHAWKGNTMKWQKKIRFKVVAKSILFTSSMMKKAMANRIKCTILYATETGKSLEYAQSLKYIFNHAFSANVTCMEDYDFSNLEHETLILVVTSTFGNGDPPENGMSLAQALLNLSNSQNGPDGVNVRGRLFTSIHDAAQQSRQLARHSSVDSLFSGNSTSTAKPAGFQSNLRFSVFGLGSRAYPHFCAFAHAIDTLLGELQGQRLLKIGEGDELCGQEESFRVWAKEAFKTACETFCVGEDVSSEAVSESLMNQDRSWSTNKFRVTDDLDGRQIPSIQEGLSRFHKRKMAVCRMKKQRNLQSTESGRSTLLVELDCPDSGEINYLPGDHLAIYPSNQPNIVERIMSRLTDDIDGNTPIQLQILVHGANYSGVISNWMSDKRLPICTVRCAFERYLDITTCPSPLILKLFAECASDENEKARLLKLSKGKAEYEEWKFHYLPNIAEVLEEFRSVKIEASLLLSQLPPLQCRYYSISSSSAVHPSEVHLTVAIVNYNTQGGKGPMHYGVCSSYLERISPGTEIHCFARKAAEFRLPSDPTCPVLMIGPGTGIAPFRSFWQQRMHEIKQGTSFGEMGLLFGCRHPDQDHLYEDEIQEAEDCGAITCYETAFSRLPGKPKQYVQHVLENKLADMAYDWLMNRNGHLYVCGDVTMADCVSKALVRMLAKKSKISETRAMHQVFKMKEMHRFHEDIFGVTFRASEDGGSLAKDDTDP